MLDVLEPNPVSAFRTVSDDTKPPRKKPAHLWKPGQSGNPSGKPPTDPNLKAAAQAHTMDALNTLVHIMKNGAKDSDRLAAASIILDRGHGKATQSVEVNGDKSTLVDLLISLGTTKVIDGEATEVPPADTNQGASTQLGGE